MSHQIVFQKTRNLSVFLISSVIVISLLVSRAVNLETEMWQVWLALGALAIGVPHGALDHLVTVPGMRPVRMAIFIAGYVAVAAISVLAILHWPLWGFVFVLVMSVIHFGMGDASFIRQSNSDSLSNVPWWVYGPVAGALPVIVPLAYSGGTQALAVINPELINWHFGANKIILWITLICAVVAILWLLATKNYLEARDLILLGALALTTPPLVAFAAYFGLWHAMRHTARLSLEISSAKKHVASGAWIKALWRVTLPGIPALIGTMAVAWFITANDGWAAGKYLWIALVVVWALTVPHMALTWRLDRKVLSSK